MVCAGVIELEVEVLVRFVVGIDRRAELRNTLSIASLRVGAILKHGSDLLFDAISYAGSW